MNGEGFGTSGAVPKGRLRWTQVAGMVGMFVLGWASAVLGATTTLHLLYESEVGAVGHFVFFSMFTAAPAVVLWMTHGRHRRGLAAGLASAWVVTLWLVFLWHPWDTMSTKEVERATAEIRDSGETRLYFGDRAGGYDWNDFYLDDSQANLFYGECRASDPESGCTDWDIEVFNERTDTSITESSSRGVNA